MKNIYKNKKILLIIIILFLVIILSICFMINRNIIPKNKDEKLKSEVIRDISFEPYSNSNNLIILVTIEDSEYGISNISYTDKNNKEININANGKTKIAIDYEVVNNGEYNFIAYNCNGEKIEKKLVIDSNDIENDTFGELIDIQITPIIDEGRTVATKADVNINYKYGLGINYYKIGNSNSWNAYGDIFQIDSYTVLNNNLQDEDNRTITIYAKNEDVANNRIVISKQTTSLDLDMPDTPLISILYTDDYPKLTEYGMKLYNEATIQFDDRDDITNYYSLDSGFSWIEYTGELSGDSDFYICAKSVKNSSGLEIISTKYAQPSSSDALGAEAYDGDESTSIYISCGTNKRIAVDSSIWGKSAALTLRSNNAGSGFVNKIESLDESDNVLNSYNVAVGYMWTNHAFSIPENTKYLRFTANSFDGRFNFNIYEIGSYNLPTINSTQYYPKLTEYGVETGYCTAIISYDSTSVQKLYKIDDGEWKIYNNEAIRLEIEQVLYAKGIDKYGDETMAISTYTATLLSDALGTEAYDGDESTSIYISCGTNKRIAVDSSIWGKSAALTLRSNNAGSGFVNKIESLDESDNVLNSYNVAVGYMWTNHAFSIPENTKYLRFTANSFDGRFNFYIYEIGGSN